MPDTPNGLTYPDSAGHTRLWEHIQALAEDVDRELTERVVAHPDVAGKRMVWKELPSAGVTDSNGFRIFNHNAGFTPRIVAATSSFPGSTFAVVWGVDNITATQMRVRFLNASGDGPAIGLATPSLMVFLGE